MVVLFYFCSAIAILTVLRIIINTDPMHSLLYLIIHLMAISGIFFSLGASFAGSLEIIIYASAVMVLFVFVIMLLNVPSYQEKILFTTNNWIIPVIIGSLLTILIIYAITINEYQVIHIRPLSSKELGVSLFGSHIVIVELISMLMLAGLVVAFHLGHKE